MNRQTVYIFSIMLCSLASCGKAQVKGSGCTDVNANNYDASAAENQGTCTYNVTSLDATVVNALPDTVSETSGLIRYRNVFWTVNDSGNDPLLWALDDKGRITRSIRIKNTSNYDWEDITQDKEYIYVGDFGNNLGDRKDLHILKISKAAITDTSTAVNAEIINFSMADQHNFTQRNITHNYDMEAFFAWDGMLHLFSKNWVDEKTRHYVLPASAGTYEVSPADSMHAGGQITGACIDSLGTHIALTGYSKNNGACFVWLLWDYKSGQYFSGNKRRMEIGNSFTFGQNEGICYVNDHIIAVSNEKRFTPQSLRFFDLKGLY